MFMLHARITVNNCHFVAKKQLLTVDNYTGTQELDLPGCPSRQQTAAECRLCPQRYERCADHAALSPDQLPATDNMLYKIGI